MVNVNNLSGIHLYMYTTHNFILYYIDQLLKVLNETEHLVGEIVSTTREHVPNITSLANNHKELLKTIEKEYQEVEK